MWQLLTWRSCRLVVHVSSWRSGCQRIVSTVCHHFSLKISRQVPREMLLTLPPVLLRVRAQKVHEELYEVVALLRCADKVRVVTMQMRLIHGM